MMSWTLNNIVSSSSKWLRKKKWWQKIGGECTRCNPHPLNPPSIMEKMHKIKPIEWRNVLTQLNRKWIEKENLSIQSFSRLMLMKESLGMQEVKKRFLEFFFSFFCGMVKLICELRHQCFINLQLPRILNLQPSALFYKNLAETSYSHGHSVRNIRAALPWK